ncbi:MAG: hypothetical protein EPO07_02305 [Verrucomicrobia bacterium]|nr:MAG: hypothetical protein EPO07_02305 [Verrucomicrobiota bacterium]
MRLIESRALPWAFDLALESRREIRLLAASLHHFQQPAAPRVGSFAEAIEIIFPTMTAARVGVVSKIKAIQIARRFSVKGDHVLRLGDAGWLSFVPGTKRHAGISPEILFSSVSGFLRRRRIA